MISSVASTSRSIFLKPSLWQATPKVFKQQRFISSTRFLLKDGKDDGNPFNRPAPPPLPPKEQREFEQLVKEKANSLQFKLPEQGEDMHPQYRAKPKPDFEGDVNPETGEVGGPKKDPLRWESEYTFNGRTTDF